LQLQSLCSASKTKPKQYSRLKKLNDEEMKLMEREEMQEAHRHCCQVFFLSLETLQDIPLSAHFSLAPQGFRSLLMMPLSRNYQMELRDQ
jgi:hypothetical protein